jgi:hypothetical protein
MFNTFFFFFFFFFFENRAIYDRTWKNIVEPDRPQMTIRRMRIACRIPKAKNTHSEYVILIAFARQQWMNERASMLIYTHIPCVDATLFQYLFPKFLCNSSEIILPFSKVVYLQVWAGIAQSV